MTASEIITKINEHASHLGSLLSQLNGALKDQGEQAKEYPSLIKKITEAEAKYAKLTSDLEATETALAKANAAKAKALKELSG